MNDITIIRKVRRENYTIINNQIFNEELSLPAVGLLTYFLSKPDDWKVWPKTLAKKLNKKQNSKASYRYILEIINELEYFNYIKKYKQGDGSVVYYIYDEQQSEPNVEKLHEDIQTQEDNSPDEENPHEEEENKKSDEPDAEKPHEENPHAEIPHDIISINLITNTNDIENGLNQTKSLACSFEDWWKIWPRKEKKKVAETKFKKLTQKELKILIATTHAHLKHKEETGEIIQHAATFLNQKVFLDYEEEIKNNKTQILETNEGAKILNTQAEILTAKIKKTLQTYKASSAEIKEKVNKKPYVEYKTSEGADFFKGYELEALEQLGADLEGFIEMEFQDGEILRILKGYL